MIFSSTLLFVASNDDILTGVLLFLCVLSFFYTRGMLEDENEPSIKNNLKVDKKNTLSKEDIERQKEERKKKREENKKKKDANRKRIEETKRLRELKKEEEDKRKAEKRIKEWKESQKKRELALKNREEKQRLILEKWKSENLQVFNSDRVLKKSLKELGQITHKCNKCSFDLMRIWHVTEALLIVRCEGCKKKTEYKSEELISKKENFILSDFTKHISYYKKRQTYDARKSTKNLCQSNKRTYRLGTYALKITNEEGMIKSHPETYKYIIKSTLEPQLKVTKSNSKKAKRSRRIPQDVMDDVWRRDEGKCVQCGTNENLEFDHIIPHSKGGANTYRNIQLLCANCNRLKSDSLG